VITTDRNIFLRYAVPLLSKLLEAFAAPLSNPTGAAVQQVSVSAPQNETGLSRSAVTNRSGEYIVLELPVGHYSLQAQAKGFKTCSAGRCS
jgi:hypothetical protein